MRFAAFITTTILVAGAAADTPKNEKVDIVNFKYYVEANGVIHNVEFIGNVPGDILKCVENNPLYPEPKEASLCYGQFANNYTFAVHFQGTSSVRTRIYKNTGLWGEATFPIQCKQEKSGRVCYGVGPGAGSLEAVTVQLRYGKPPNFP